MVFVNSYSSLYLYFIMLCKILRRYRILLHLLLYIILIFYKKYIGTLFEGTIIAWIIGIPLIILIISYSKR